MTPSVRSDISPKYDNLNLVGGLSDQCVGFGGGLAKCLSIRERGVAEAGGKVVCVWEHELKEPLKVISKIKKYHQA